MSNYLLAEEGKVKAAVQKYNLAQKLNPELLFDSEAWARQLAQNQD